MLGASIVVETLPGKAHAVAERMGRIKGMGPLAEQRLGLDRRTLDEILSETM